MRLAPFAGIAGTVVMEVVGITGFRVAPGMPGSLPMPLGVLLTNRFMAGPNRVLNLIGREDHFGNGIGLAFIDFAASGRQRWWAGFLCALSVATLFMLRPEMMFRASTSLMQDCRPVKVPVTGLRIAS
ncbi:MAG: hypothetical protein M0Z44_06585 [Gammaproteobacteria bacterium]|nr:hypothetical protein [Gammaproteobacteria bacterium]